jgi:DNA-binding response OmpR family regulator
MHSSQLAADNQISTNHLAGVTKVLVIDDDFETTDLLKIILEPNSFDVYTANSAPTGIEMAHKLSPDVMIVDLLMPGMDGLKVCKEVREFSNVPILVLSAVNKPGIVARALDEGADDYLAKPMKSSVLIAHLNKLARRARAEKEASKGNGKYRL